MVFGFVHFVKLVSNLFVTKRRLSYLNYLLVPIVSSNIYARVQSQFIRINLSDGKAVLHKLYDLLARVVDVRYFKCL